MLRAKLDASRVGLLPEGMTTAGRGKVIRHPAGSKTRRTSFGQWLADIPIKKQNGLY
jgi:hypothetical protein